MSGIRRGAVLLALVLASCGILPSRDVPVPPARHALVESTRGEAPAAAAESPIAVGPPRGGDAHGVPPQPLLAGVPEAASASATAAKPPPAGDITLDFNDADIRTVAGVVLRDILKRNYVVDPEVSGKVSLSTSRPLTREQVLPAFEAVLESLGATLVESDGLIRVTPLGKGKLKQTPRIARDGGPRFAGQTIEVFPLRFLAPSQAQHVLEPVLSRGRVVLADDARRMLLVQGSADELATARDALKIFDVDQLAGTQVAMQLLHSADAPTLVAELNNLFSGIQKTAAPGVVRFIPIERLNAVVILAREPRYMAQARVWIERLDKARRLNEKQLYVYHVQHGKAAEVARTLRGIFGAEEPPEPPQSVPQTLDYGAVPMPGAAGALAQVPTAGAPQNGPSGSAAAPSPAAPAPTEAAAPEAAAGTPAPAQPVAGPRIQADEANNSLLVQATPREFAQVKQVLDQIDIPPLQVLVQATVAEVTLTDALRYGVEYAINSGQFGLLLTQGISPVAITPQTPGFAVALSGGLAQPRALIEALSQITQTNVISTPRLLVLDNQTARLQVGDVVPIVTQTAVGTLTNTPLQINSVQYRDTGVVIEVTPRVNASGFVTLDIAQSVSDVVRTTTSNIDSPTIRQRSIHSAIGVQSGQTVLLGGLIRAGSTRSRSGIPFLVDLPVVGPLFGTRDNSADRTEIIVLLTPRVVHNPQEADDVTREISRKYEALLLTDPSLMPLPPRP